MNYKDINIEIPLFYNNEFGLRFEIGPPEIAVWKDCERRILNKMYFDTALERASNIFEQVFATDDEISIVYQVFLNRRNKIRKKNFIFKQISKIEQRNIIITKYRSLDTENFDCVSYHWNKAIISELKTKDVNIRNLLLGLINTDFSMNQPAIRGQCFFINHTKDIVLNLYDDRGMDIVALEKRALEDLYISHSECVLEYDRERIDKIFSVAMHDKSFDNSNHSKHT